MVENQVICKIVEKFPGALSVEVPDVRKNESFHYSITPFQWEKLNIGSYYLCEVISQSINGFYMREVHPVRPCTENGEITGGKLDNVTAETPIFCVTEKDPKRGIRIRIPFPMKKPTQSDFIKPEGWERVEPGMVLRGYVSEAYWQVSPIR